MPGCVRECGQFRPGSIFTEDQCRPCWLAYHDPRWVARHGAAAEPRPDWRQRQADATACRHRGEATGETVRCQGCQSTLDVPTHACARHGRCTETVLAPGLACCRICPDRQAPDARTALLLECRQAPGDALVMTAAVEALHATYPGRYRTWVRTPAPEIWDHNPHVEAGATPAGAQQIVMEYPLIHQSDSLPVHFLQGYCDFLADRLGVPLRPTRNRPALYLTEEERMSPPLLGQPGRYWLLNAGVKHDYTAKQYPYFAEVARLLEGRIAFVQVGEAHHRHPLIPGAHDLRGRTTTRDLVRLVAHADGVLTGVSFPMHLAAALDRPAVVVAGGREPRAWNTYPRQTFLSTVGMLSCCQDKACWKSRVVPLGDGDPKDRDLCTDPAPTEPPAGRCMTLIRPEDVAWAILSYHAPSGSRMQTDCMSLE